VLIQKRRKRLVTPGASVFSLSFATAFMVQPNVNAEIVPTGKLRVGLNGSNATLVVRAPDGGVNGIAADLGRFIAEKLGVPFEPVVYAGAATYTASFGKGEWDIIVTGRNPLAATLVDFMPDVILIDYVYIAAPGREFADVGQVDRTGVRIGVPRNASADAFLSRSLKFAKLIRMAGDAEVAVDMLRDGKIDLYATGIESVQRIADRLPGSKIIGAFETVAFAISTAKGWSTAAQSRLTQLVNEAKAAGIVQKAIEKSGRTGVRAAP
jgi:polar amino acid transport system substrate-binding protein